MRFACPKCSTRYFVADDSVPAARTLRFTCKSCGYVMRLRRKKGSSAEAQPRIQNTPTDPLLSGAVTPAGGFSLSEVEARNQQAGRIAPTGRVATPPPPPVDTSSEQEPIWFLLIGGEQIGPVSRERVLFMLQEREIDRRTYAWKEGMADWIRLESIDTFKSEAENAGDARWRVVAPIENEPAKSSARSDISPVIEEPVAVSPIAEEPTVAIDRAELEKVLAKTVESPAVDPEPMIAEEPTVAIDREELEKVLAKTVQSPPVDEKTEEKAKAEREAEEKAKAEREAEEKAKAEREAEEKAKAEREAEEKAKAEREAEEKAKAEREAEEKAKAEREAEEKAKAEREAEEKAKAEREAEEKAKAEREAEEKAKAEREAEEKAKAEREAEEKAKAEREAEEKAKAEREAEEKAKAEREAEEKAKAEREAEEKAKAEREAEEKAKAEREAEEKAKAEREAEEKAKAEREAEEKKLEEDLPIIVDTDDPDFEFSPTQPEFAAIEFDEATLDGASTRPEGFREDSNVFVVEMEGDPQVASGTDTHPEPFPSSPFAKVLEEAGEPVGGAAEGESNPDDFVSAAAMLAGVPTGQAMNRNSYGSRSEVSETGLDTQEMEIMKPLRMGARPNENYIKAAPGEATRVFMQTAGIFDRQRKNRNAAIVGVLLFSVLTGIITLDVMGIWSIPGMGRVYETLGQEDPDVERATKRTTEKLTQPGLSETERAALRQKLMGLGKKTKTKRAKLKPVAEQGIDDTKSLSKNERSVASNIFNDRRRKKSRKIKLAKPEDIVTPNLPDGLTRDAIFKVISRNQTAMKVCVNQSMQRGERLPGKVEVGLTIVAQGTVSNVDLPGSFADTSMGLCAEKSMLKWRFPKFNGTPVPVQFPLVIGSSAF